LKEDYEEFRKRLKRGSMKGVMNHGKEKHWTQLHLAAGAGAVALAAKNHKDNVKNEVKKAAANAPEQEYRNTERGKNEKNSKGIYYTNGNYEAFARPKKPQGVDEKSAYIVGSGLASLAAACFLVRDGQMPGDHIHILEAMDIAGGACDGIYDADQRLCNAWRTLRWKIILSVCGIYSGAFHPLRRREFLFWMSITG